MDIIELAKWSFPDELPYDVWKMYPLLVDYAGIPEKQVETVLRETRDTLWGISRTPYSGRWKFLRVTDPDDGLYQQVLFRLKLSGSKDALLDLGCGLGQILRQLRADGAEGSRLFGVDNEPRFIEVGYKLFKDRKHLNAIFVIGDLTDPDDPRLRCLKGKVTMIHAASFFHLFSWRQQLYIGKRLVGFLRRGSRNALIYGRDAGRLLGISSTDGSGPYIHNEASFQMLWDEIGRLTGTNWRVYVEHEGLVENVLGIRIPIVAMNWVVYQVTS